MTIIVQTPLRIRVLIAASELRDEARAAALAEPIDELLGGHPALSLASDLAAITSHLLDEYVVGLDDHSRRVVELSFAGPQPSRDRGGS